MKNQSALALIFLFFCSSRYSFSFSFNFGDSSSMALMTCHRTSSMLVLEVTSISTYDIAIHNISFYYQNRNNIKLKTRKKKKIYWIFTMLTVFFLTLMTATATAIRTVAPIKTIKIFVGNHGVTFSKPMDGSCSKV